MADANKASAQVQQPPTEPFKEGQKKPTPPPADATRVFYESLYRQNPSSKLATAWCVQFGVLEDGELETALKRLESA